MTNIRLGLPDFKPIGVHSRTARIRPKADGTYDYDSGGQQATTLAVEDRYGNFVDVVAWGRNPRQWWLQRGDQTPILGARALAMAAWYGEPVFLHGTPEAWLRVHFPVDGKTGHRACVLRWDLDLKPLFAGVRIVHCETAKIERRLLRLFRTWEPKTTSPPEAKRHAA